MHHPTKPCPFAAPTIPAAPRDRTFRDWRSDKKGQQQLAWPSKTQGDCGCCWAFGSTEQIRSDYKRLTGDDPGLLSMQQMISCAPSDSNLNTLDPTSTVGGCKGNDPEWAFLYANAVGLLKDSAYTYENGTCTTKSDDGTCATLPCGFKETPSVFVKDCFKIEGDDPEGTEKAMADYVLTEGPLLVSVATQGWDEYKKGDILDSDTCKGETDHVVQIVGVNTQGEKGGKPYWIIKNSWGPEWGDEGTIQMSSGENTCNITYQPMYTTIVGEYVGDYSANFEYGDKTLIPQ
tara:strand:+ start:62 stop:931 length:870 start_codon:yes stop_codon:yes gene_type:complete